MNKIFKTVWNTARQSLVVVNEATSSVAQSSSAGSVRGGGQNSNAIIPSGKAIAVATLAALSIFSSQALAARQYEQFNDTFDGWSFEKAYSNNPPQFGNYTDYVLSATPWADALSSAINKTFTQADLQAVRGQFPDYGNPGDTETWGIVAGVHTQNASTPISGGIENLSVNLTTEQFTDDGEEFDVMGVYHTAGGEVSYTGDASVVVQNNVSMNEYGVGVSAYDIETPEASDRTITFNTDNITLQAVNTASGGAATALSINIHEASATVNFASGNVSLIATTSGSVIDATSPEAESESPDAFGIDIFEEWGNEAENGKTATVVLAGAQNTINATSELGTAYGIKMENGTLNFNGPTTVTAQGETGSYALYVEQSEDSANLTSATVGVNAETTLNGDVFVAQGATFNLAETVTINGATSFAGAMTGAGHLVTNGDTEVTGTVSIGDLTVQGGTFNAVGAVTGTGTATIESGATVRFAEEFTFGTHIFKAGSTLVYENVIDAGEGFAEFGQGITQLYGTTLLLGQDRIAPHSVVVQDVGSEVQFLGGEYNFSQKFQASEGKVTISNGALVTADSFAVGNGVVSVTSSDSAGGVLKANSITFSGTGTLTVENGGTLETSSGQVFTTALDAEGSVGSAGSLKHEGKLIFADGSYLTLNDSKYNLSYANSAADLVTGNVVFTGTLVDESGEDMDAIDIGSAVEDVIHEDTNIAAKGDGSFNVTVEKDVGGKTLIVESAHKVTISDGKTLTLVGTSDSSLLIDFRDDDGTTQTSVEVNGGLQLGLENTQTSGTLDMVVNLLTDAELKVAGGEFSLSNVTSAGADIEVNDGAALSVSKLEVAGDSKTTITGSLSVEDLVKKAGDALSAIINIGKTGTADEGGARGDLILGLNSKLSGLTLFLDPTYVDGQEVTDASRLVFPSATLDGNVAVGQNSYAVLGAEDDAEFTSLFKDGTLTWGDGEGETLAAVYVGKAIAVTGGSLTVDGSLTSAPKMTPGAVTFAENSVLVANVTDLADGESLITADSFDVDATSKAVVVGTLKNGETYKLTNAADADFWNTETTLVSGNKLWDLTANEDGTFTTKLQDAALVYGNLMQGHAVANAGIVSTDAATADYVNTLLTDETGTLSSAFMAARFDAAMNPAGALGTFTTAYDRASDLRQIVRNEAAAGEGNRLWAQVSGGFTDFDGISTGAQDLDLETDVYGIVIGGEAKLSRGVVGVALTAGTGDTENDDVHAKDEFDYYGLSVYGKTTVAGFDVLADASMTFVESDMTVGGVADVDTDTTTAVYSAGAQVQKTFELGVDVTPFVGVDVYHVRGDGFKNGHGAKVEDSDATAVEFPIGATFSKNIETANGMKVSPNFMFAVVPTVGDTDIDSKVRLAGAQSTYNFTFADDVKVRSRLGVTAEKGNFALGLSAGYEWGNEERSATSVRVNAQYRF